MRTPDYVQVVGFIDQTKINLAADDSGGELDPHGAVREVGYYMETGANLLQ